MFRMINAQQFIGSLLEAVAMARLINTTPRSIGPGRKTSGLRRTGYAHEHHCGARQQARYQRQIAAGQISFIKHGPRVA